jgi:hypothetical protein
MMPLPVAVTVPPIPRGSSRSWRRLITTVAEGASGSRGMDGAWLDSGCAYEIPVGAVVLACDTFSMQRNVRMYTPDESVPGGLRLVKGWDIKAPLGKAVTGFIARRLAAGAANHKAVPVDGLPNRYDGTCMLCSQPVARHEGITAKDRDDGRTRVAHPKGACPPPPPLPAREEPNKYAGACRLCGGWVEAGTGAAVLAKSPEPGSKANYQPVHLADCPEPPPGPLNSRHGWCSECFEEVGQREGCWMPGPGTPAARVLVHHPRCPRPADTVPTWVVRAPEGYPRAGEVIRARIDTRNGGPVISEDIPGYRVLTEDTGYTQIYGYITDVIPSPMRVRVRACDAEEACPLIEEDAAAAAAVTVHGPGFRGQWAVEQIGDKKPWVAEITGWHPSYGFERAFRRCKVDYSGTNKRGTRGTMFCWTLELDTVYEAWWMRSWSDHHRAFLRVTPDGDVEQIGRGEVEAWLAVQQQPAR